MRAGVFHARNGNNQRRVHVVLHVAVFAPGVVLAEFPAVVAPEDDDGVGTQVQAVKFIEHLAHLGVRVADGGVVAVLELACKVIGDMAFGNAAVLAEFAGGHDGVIRRINLAERIRSELDLRRVVEVPVSFWRHERQVGLDKTNCEKVDDAAVAVESPPEPKQQRQKQPSAAKPKKQPPYAVVVLNDNQHSFQYVIDTFMKVFGYPLEKSYSLALQIHTEGRGIVWSGAREVAELKRDQIRSAGPDFYAQKRVEFPLGVTIEPLPG